MGDPYYKHPIDIVGGCNCKKVCKACFCKKGDKSKNRLQICTPITCSHCKCFGENRECMEEVEEPSSELESDFSSDTDSYNEIEPSLNVMHTTTGSYDIFAGYDFSSSEDEY